MSEIETFKASVEAFIQARGWTPTRFGREAAGDPLFVFQIREGREPRQATRDRVRRFIAETSEQARAS
jgi:homoserine dehydrogenase